MTQQKSKLEFLQRQLADKAVFFLQIFHTLCHHNNLTEVRAYVTSLRTNDKAFTWFSTRVETEIPYFSQYVEQIASLKSVFLRLPFKMSAEGLYVVDPVHKLWLFLLRLVYERPYLIEIDDGTGTRAADLRNELVHFIDNTMVIDYSSEK